ncbi:hypothetical protein [Actinocorallia libanotica]|uniref:Uncharacterized protein n=1 Tax=Actinocorallia libanotica TaxID=46162 RepID=A0ABN1RF13_9ACTN
MSDQLDTSDIARLLNISRSRARWLRTDPGFPEPAGRNETGSEYWYETPVLRWAAGQESSLADQAPLLYRPASGRPAPYLSATALDGHLMLSWASELGKVGFLHTPGPAEVSKTPRALQRLVSLADVAVLVGVNGGLWNMWGPELCAVDADRPDRPYMPRWTDVQQAIGMPVPYWIPGLNQPQKMARWRPGSPPAVVPARHPYLDTAPLLRLFSDEPDASTAGQAALALAREIDRRFTREIVSEINAIHKAMDKEAIALATTVDPLPRAAELDEVILRDGWAQILARTDQLARDCVGLALSWDGGFSFPYGDLAELDPQRSPYAREFIARLQPTPATAGHSVTERTPVHTWSDPATDAPAITSDDGLVYAAVPFRIPSTGELTEAVLHDGQVWIRTSDDTLYLAPARSGNGLSWGYSGSGPTTLAELLDRLLDDITTPALHASTSPDDFPRGLFELVRGIPQNGSAVLTRAQLLAARRQD